MRIEPCDATLGATITGVDLAGISQVDWITIETAFLEYAVLIFPGQHLTSADQVAFAKRFGEIEILVPGREIVPLSNVAADGTVRTLDNPVVHTLIGNEGWHMDSTYQPVQALGAVLQAVVVPDEGGETEWADMRVGYQALDSATRETITGLAALHSILYSQTRAGFGSKYDGAYGYDVETPPLRPLVKTHPVTGLPALCIGRHAHAIPGMSEADSETLLDRLMDDACQPPRTLLHRWKPGDVIVWDNRCLLHRARPYDRSDNRVMKHVRIAGDPQSEAGL